MNIYKKEIVMSEQVIEQQDTIVDPFTGLMWQVESSKESMPWQEAMDYASELELGGYNDWRLPTVEELKMLWEHGLFPEASSYYWSSSSGANGTNGAWVVYFSNGYVYNDNRAYNYYARCVRL